MAELSPQHREARAAHMAGMCVVPCRTDGSKAPIGEWKEYQSKRPGKQQIDRWFGDGHEGIGVICGEVSGGLTMMEFEDDETWNLFQDNADSIGLGDLLEEIVQGWSERAPRGGIHLYYLCPDTRGNKKLARTVDDNGKPAEVLIETRGEGGFTVIAPTGGSAHPTGIPYVRLAGGPGSVASISPDDQRDLWQLAAVFDEAEPRKHDEPAYVGHLRPGDDYNNRTDWRDLLEPHGWTFLFERQGVWYLRRPGKDRGVSATVNWGGLGLFRNFSSSTPFDERAYTKFSVYCTLEHQGDFRAAAKALAERGYGARDQSRVSEAEPPTWREPDPLERPGFPTFPVHYLPESIRGFCKAVSASIQVPPDYPALTILSSLSAATRGRYEVGVEEQGYSEPLVLQTVLFAKSGTRKSASFAAVKRPLIRYERRKRSEDERELEIWQNEFDRLEKDIKKAKSSAIVNDFAVRDMIRQREDMKRDKPVVTRIIADDVTPERLGTLVVEQRGPIAVMAPEGGFIGNVAGRYAGGIPNLEYILRGHAGEPLDIDRMGRESRVAAAYVTLGISLQPALLNEMAAIPGFAGKGMAARLLPAFPPSYVGRRDVRQSRPLDQDEAAVWHAVINTILAEAEECLTDSYGDHIPYRLVLSPDARELYYQYSAHVERQLARGGGLYHMDDWGGKMVGHTLRVAGLFHLVEAGTDAVQRRVSRQTLANAIGVMEYFVPHAKYMMDRINGMGYGENLEEMMKVIREMDQPILRSSLHSKLRNSTVFKGSRDYISETLDELELLGYLRLVPDAGKSRIEVNPSVEDAVTYTGFSIPNTPSGSFTLEEDEDEFWE